MVKPRFTKVRKHPRKTLINKKFVDKHKRMLSVNRRGNFVLSTSTSKKKSMNLGTFSHCLSSMINKDFDVLMAKGMSEKQALKKLDKQYGDFKASRFVEIQRGFIADLAKKAYLGLKHAVEWERKHLPSQVRWIKKEYAIAKKNFKEGYRIASDKARFLRQNLRDFAKSGFKRDEIDQAERDSERDLNDDGLPDVPKEAFALRNAQIRSQLSKIDTNRDGTPDSRQLLTGGTTEDLNDNAVPDSKEDLVRDLVSRGSPLDRLLKEKKKLITTRKELVKLEAEAPVSLLITELQSSPNLIFDLPEEKLKQLAIRMPKSAGTSIPFIKRGIPSPMAELEKRRFRKKRLEKRGF